MGGGAFYFAFYPPDHSNIYNVNLRTSAADALHDFLGELIKTSISEKGYILQRPALTPNTFLPVFTHFFFILDFSLT